MAALIAAFLGWRTLSQQGPAVVISFHSADGLEPGKTRVKFKDVELGVVNHVMLRTKHLRASATHGRSA